MRRAHLHPGTPTGKDVSGREEGQGITALFVSPCRPLLSEAGNCCARLSHSRTASVCDVSCPPPPSHSSLPMIIDLSVAGVISGNRALLPPPPGGAQKKKGLFSSVKKNHLGGSPPPPSQNREVAEAPFSREVSRGLVGSYSSELCVGGGGGASRQNAKRRGGRWAVRRSASEKKCRSHSAPAFNRCSCWRRRALGRCATASLTLVPRTYPLSTPPQMTHKPIPCTGSQKRISVRVNK